MRATLQITRIHWRQKAQLERAYRTAECPRFRTRIQMALLSIGGKGVSEIANIVRQSDDTVRRWLHRYGDEGYKGLIEREHTGRRATITAAMDCFLMTCIRQSPRGYGEDRASWTTAGLGKVVEVHFGVQVTDECIRQHLERIGIVCRRPTWTVKHLAEQQAGYVQKKVQSQGSCDILLVALMCMCRMKLK